MPLWCVRMWRGVITTTSPAAVRAGNSGTSARTSASRSSSPRAARRSTAVAGERLRDRGPAVARLVAGRDVREEVLPAQAAHVDQLAPDDAGDRQSDDLVAERDRAHELVELEPDLRLEPHQRERLGPLGRGEVDDARGMRALQDLRARAPGAEAPLPGRFARGLAGELAVAEEELALETSPVSPIFPGDEAQGAARALEAALEGHRAA